MNDAANVAAVRPLHVGADLSRDRLWALLADDAEWYALGSPDVLPWAGTVRDGLRGGPADGPPRRRVRTASSKVLRVAGATFAARR